MIGHIIITGPMGVGKTTLGRHLAATTGRPFFDSDVHIERILNQSGRDIATRHGVAYLHQLEREFVEQAAAETQGAVIASAASTADHPLLLHRLGADGHLIVYLDAQLAGLRVAAAEDSHRRPILDEEALALGVERKRNAVAAGALIVEATGSDGGFKSVAQISATLAGAAPSFFDG